jgi:transcriptional regulator with XRE-family HTH domain
MYSYVKAKSPMPSLRRIRRQHLFSMRELASKAGVTYATIYLIESGKTKHPRNRVIQAISQALRTDPADIDEFRPFVPRPIGDERPRRSRQTG